MSKKRSELFQKKNLKKGISLILCNTHKGKFLLDHIDSQVNLVELSENEAFSQDALKSSNRMIPKERYLIYNNLDNEDWEPLIEKNLHVNFTKLRTMYHIHEVKKTIKEVIKEMIFYNEGIFLTTNEGDILNDLKYLESQGVDIVSCGTCLDFFNRKELLQVGTVKNM